LIGRNARPGPTPELGGTTIGGRGRRASLLITSVGAVVVTVTLPGRVYAEAATEALEL